MMMERNLGSEIVRTFGARLKRIYELDETTLPPQVGEWLERLKKAEAERAARCQQDLKNSNF